MWFTTSALLGLLATGIMFTLCMAVGSAPMAQGHFNYSVMYVVILVCALASAFLTRHRTWPLVLLGTAVFSVPVVWFSHSRYHDFSVADANRWARDAQQWENIMVIAPVCAILAGAVFIIFSKPSARAEHEQKND